MKATTLKSRWESGKKYEVIVISTDRKCGHKHRTKRTAGKCLKKLLYGGCYALEQHKNLHNAEWHNAIIQEVKDCF